MMKAVICSAVLVLTLGCSDDGVTKVLKDSSLADLIKTDTFNPDTSSTASDLMSADASSCDGSSPQFNKCGGKPCIPPATYLPGSCEWVICGGSSYPVEACK